MVMIRDRDQGRRDTFLTGVSAGYRSQGVATGLKVAHARALRDSGWRFITTQNMQGNEHILASNARLGFQRKTARAELMFDY
jgi:hypothetical protein